MQNIESPLSLCSDSFILPVGVCHSNRAGARKQSQHTPGAETPKRSMSAPINLSLHLPLQLPLESHLQAAQTEGDSLPEDSRVISRTDIHQAAATNSEGSLLAISSAVLALLTMMRVTGVIRYMALFLTLLGTWYLMQTYFDRSWKAISLRSWLGATSKSNNKQQPRHKCGNQKGCPENYFAFKIISGAANVVGPSICFNGVILMSGVKNNIGRGLNIALVNGTNGQLLKTDTFDMYSGDINKLDTFLQQIERGTIVLTASYDDAATKMNDKVRAHFVELGSSHVSQLGFRDNWVFLGAKGLKNKSPFEGHIKNDVKTNKYDGWPELLEMEGCVPRKMD